MSKKQQDKKANPDVMPNAHFRDLGYMEAKIATVCGAKNVHWRFYDEAKVFPSFLDIVLDEKTTIKGLFQAREMVLRFVSVFEGRVLDALDSYEVRDSSCRMNYRFDPAAYDEYLKRGWLQDEILATRPKQRELKGIGTPEVNEELYRRCLAEMIREKRCSHSMLQRAFLINAGEADAVIELAKKRGVISDDGVVLMEGGEV
ncbi:hypothetical protein [Akkermansia glycaniphila]|uniref:Uncharacterized protein n=1 Tax=Akkermansia glycaniphila TaxID=1679444 RepID=A0A1C7P9E2_9BACT|nr:hypothetical protein [Akkermansia glycaniphila]OCA02180.1 hypothetical protein AC781_11515 [Akkermansia glycaniphila]SEH99467.1 Hypothetical protein PYTT_2396 [Akkermansia glycaniphila]